MRNILLIFIIICVFLSGCVSYQSARPMVHRDSGVYHKVRPKETLWRISKAYNVSLEDIVRANKIPNAAKIERGQLIFIPGASSIVKTTEINSSSKTSTFIWPVKGKVVAYYGSNIAGRRNKGIDIQAGGDTNIYASREGKVSFLGELKGYGKTIIIEHRDSFSTVYANIIETEVKLNSNVSQGSVIAKAPSSKNDRSFIHFEIRAGYNPQNPLFYLP